MATSAFIFFPTAGGKRPFAQVEEDHQISESDNQQGERYDRVNINGEQVACDQSDGMVRKPLFANWLFVKQEGSWWKRRFVSLVPGRIEWSVTPFSKCEGSLPLYSNTFVEINENSDALWFTLLPSSTSRQIRFKCDSEAQILDWKENIERILDCASPPPLNQSGGRISPTRAGLLLRTVSSQDENIGSEEVQVKECLRTSIKELEAVCLLVAECLRTESALQDKIRKMRTEKKRLMELFNQRNAKLVEAQATLASEVDAVGFCEDKLFELEHALSELRQTVGEQTPKIPRRSTKRKWANLVSAISNKLSEAVAHVRGQSSGVSADSQKLQGRIVFEMSRTSLTLQSHREKVLTARFALEGAQTQHEEVQRDLRNLGRDFMNAEEAFEHNAHKLIDLKRELRTADMTVRHWEHQLDILRSLRKRQTDETRAQWLRLTTGDSQGLNNDQTTQQQRRGVEEQKSAEEKEEIIPIEGNNLPSGLVT